MRELIGACELCNEKIYCDGGFFDGANINGKLYCESCEKKWKPEK
jgi:hypothetical protein